MKATLPRWLLGILFIALLANGDAVLAQEASIVEGLVRGAMEVLGRDAAREGTEGALRKAFQKTLSEAAESGTTREVAQTQLARVIAQNDPLLIEAAEGLPGRALPLLNDVPASGLRGAVEVLNRPGVAESVAKLDASLRYAAIQSEQRLPGAGLKIVQHYGEDGATLARSISEDQANNLIAVARPNAVNALTAADRQQLFDALARPGAKLRNLRNLNGPMIVVASGVVLWHAADVGLAPDEKIIEQPDGTVVREKTSFGSITSQHVFDVSRVPLLVVSGLIAAAVAFLAILRFWPRSAVRVQR